MPSTPFGQVDITCVIFGCPRPEVGWYRDGYLIEKSNLVNWTVNERIEGLSITTLTIHNFSDGDEGTYSCTGTNTIDMAFWDTELLNYRGEMKMRFNILIQRIIVIPSKITSVVFTAIAEALKVQTALFRSAFPKLDSYSCMYHTAPNRMSSVSKHRVNCVLTGRWYTIRF